MIQCFADKNYKPSYRSATEPHLVSSAKIFKSFSKHLRSMHRHDDLLEINLVCEGGGIYVVENCRYEVTRGDIIIINSELAHDEEHKQNLEYYRYDLAINNIQIPGLKENALIPDMMKPVFHTGKHFEPLINIMETLHTLMARKESTVDSTVHYLMISALTLVEEIIRTSDNPMISTDGTDHKYGVIEMVENYIDQHYTEDILLDDLANLVNLSPYHLSHIFKEKTGYSPIQYVVRRRLGEAQTLLIKTNMSITDIASTVGYGNPSYFNALFTKKIGMAPRDYRKEYTIE